MKDNELALIHTELKDTAVKLHSHGCLRNALARVVHPIVAENKRLQAEVARLKSVLYAVAVDAHMEGQYDAEIDPSFSNAQSYAEKYKQGEQNG